MQKYDFKKLRQNLRSDVKNWGNFFSQSGDQVSHVLQWYSENFNTIAYHRPSYQTSKSIRFFAHTVFTPFVVGSFFISLKRNCAKVWFQKITQTYAYMTVCLKKLRKFLTSERKFWRNLFNLHNSSQFFDTVCLNEIVQKYDLKKITPELITFRCQKLR